MAGEEQKRIADALKEVKDKEKTREKNAAISNKRKQLTEEASRGKKAALEQFYQQSHQYSSEPWANSMLRLYELFYTALRPSLVNDFKCIILRLTQGKNLIKHLFVNEDSQEFLSLTYNIKVNPNGSASIQDFVVQGKSIDKFFGENQNASMQCQNDLNACFGGWLEKNGFTKGQDDSFTNRDGRKLTLADIDEIEKMHPFDSYLKTETRRCYAAYQASENPEDAAPKQAPKL